VNLSESGLDFLFLPHQLVVPQTSSTGPKTAWMLEEHLFYSQYRFHRQKLIHQRACMKVLAQELQGLGWTVHYTNSKDPHSDIRSFLEQNASRFAQNTLHLYRCSDHWLQKRILTQAQKLQLNVVWLPNPLFLDNPMDDASWFKGKKRFLQADYYRKQRIQRHILLEPQSQEPLGGRWSYDEDNRKRYPAQASPPAPPALHTHKAWDEACNYTQIHYPLAPGSEKGDWTWPVTRQEALSWFKAFLEHRFQDFGPYEDALDVRHRLLHHSAISPLLNNGLLRPQEVLELSLDHGQRRNLPLPSIEGWVRQIMGWREFIHGVYEHAGVQQRTRNFWGFTHPMPSAFYNATTGIEPVDHCIRSLLNNAYNHHIERLMVLSNFMLLCEIHPDAVYRWFMEMYIDAYDWVMVPNVYGMGQFADGGMMSTKPYVSSSNYILKMSNFRADPSWTEPWDALYWRFMSTHRDFFMRNPRSMMMIRQWERKSPEQQQNLLDKAEQFLEKIHRQSQP